MAKGRKKLKMKRLIALVAAVAGAGGYLTVANSFKKGLGVAGSAAYAQAPSWGQALLWPKLVGPLHQGVMSVYPNTTLVGFVQFLLTGSTSNLKS